MYAIKTYDRFRAVEYARRWALSRSPLFENYTGFGGDCTNFVSQCILAGCCLMDLTETFGWYYIRQTDRAPAWTGVKYIYDYLTGSGDFPSPATHAGPFGMLTGRRNVREGDIIQLANKEGLFYHTVIISGFECGDILVCAHSDDSLDRKLSTYSFDSMRIIHISGIRTVISECGCFRDLFDGKAMSGIEIFKRPEPQRNITQTVGIY